MVSAEVILQSLPELAQDLLTFLSQKSRECQVPLYLVGGIIRDVLLSEGVLLGRGEIDTASQNVVTQVRGVRFERLTLDIDIAIEGDTKSFLECCLKQGAQDAPSSKNSPQSFHLVHYHVFPRYRTAKAEFERQTDGRRLSIDFAQCREESYSAPAATPEVSWASISKDLWRRDFSINAIALALSTDDREVLDPCSGLTSLRAQQLDILHHRSFVDDPIRLLRGYRFAHRFGFSFGSETAALATEALQAGWLEKVSPYRRFDEFRKAMYEPNVDLLLRECATVGLLTQLHPLLQTAFAKNDTSNILVGALEGDQLSKRCAKFLSVLTESELQRLEQDWQIRKKDKPFLYEA